MTAAPDPWWMRVPRTPAATTVYLVSMPLLTLSLANAWTVPVTLLVRANHQHAFAERRGYQWLRQYTTLQSAFAILLALLRVGRWCADLDGAARP